MLGRRLTSRVHLNGPRDCRPAYWFLRKRHVTSFESCIDGSMTVYTKLSPAQLSPLYTFTHGEKSALLLSLQSHTHKYTQKSAYSQTLDSRTLVTCTLVSY